MDFRLYTLSCANRSGLSRRQLNALGNIIGTQGYGFFSQLTKESSNKDKKECLLKEFDQIVPMTEGILEKVKEHQTYNVNIQEYCDDLSKQFSGLLLVTKNEWSKISSEEKRLMSTVEWEILKEVKRGIPKLQQIQDEYGDTAASYGSCHKGPL